MQNESVDDSNDKQDYQHYIENEEDNVGDGKVADSLAFH